MQIRTERLLLRPLGLRDLRSVFLYSSDAENTRFMLWGGKKTEAEVREFLAGIEDEWRKEAPSFYELAVVLDGRQIGAVSAYLDAARERAELGWIIGREFWGNGYATEAASYRVMRKIGMRLVSSGTERVYPLTGERSTELMCALEREGPDALC